MNNKQLTTMEVIGSYFVLQVEGPSTVIIQ